MNKRNTLESDTGRDRLPRLSQRRLSGKRLAQGAGLLVTAGLLLGCGTDADASRTANSGPASGAAGAPEAPPTTQASTTNTLPGFTETTPLNCDQQTPENQGTFVFHPAEGDYKGEIELRTAAGQSIGQAEMFYNQAAGVFRPGVYAPNSGALPDTDTPDSSTKYGGNMIGNEPATLTRNLPPTEGPLRSVTLQIVTPENAGSVQPGDLLQTIAVKAACTTSAN